MITLNIHETGEYLLRFHGPDGEVVRTEPGTAGGLDQLAGLLNICDSHDGIELDKLPLFGPEPPESCDVAWYSCDGERVLLMDYDTDQWYVSEEGYGKV